MGQGGGDPRLGWSPPVPAGPHKDGVWLQRIPSAPPGMWGWGVQGGGGGLALLPVAPVINPALSFLEGITGLPLQPLAGNPATEEGQFGRGWG